MPLSLCPDTAIPAPSRDWADAARRRQAQLTKPAGALGQLESLAIALAGLQGCARPRVDPVAITVFAADHGIAASAGVSAYPQAVTAQMIVNFGSGGAAIAVLSQLLNARLEVVNLGTVGPLPDHQIGRVDAVIAPATADFRQAPAMTNDQVYRALAAGRAALDRAAHAGCRLFIAGEMGIGNTTAATAVACALLGQSAAALIGPGTGVDAAGLARKHDVIEQALAHHSAELDRPGEVLRRLGGFEIAALVGALQQAARRRIPILVDGYIVTVAALAAVQLEPDLRPWLLFAHRSDEPGHRHLLDALEARPLLALDMRLGEGSGAAVALPLLRAACALHNDMATFDEAGVSDRDSGG